MNKIQKMALGHLCIVLMIVGSISLVLGPVNVEAREYYQIIVDGKAYGSYDTKKEATEAVVEARVKATEKIDNLVLSDFSYKIEKTSSHDKDKKSKTVDELSQIMIDNQMKDVVGGYLLKTDGYSIVLESKEAVFTVLDRVVDYQDINNEFSILMEECVEEGQITTKANIWPVKPELTGDVVGMSFTCNVVAVQVYVSADEIVPVEQAVATIIGENRINIYVTKREQYTEEYNLDTQYIEETSWYTSEKEVIEEGIAGVHDVTAHVTYLNGAEVNRVIIADNVISQPVARVVKIGTKEQPTFIKPLRGGSFSSGFGSRWGRKHEGVDWSCSIGTTVVASSGGTVTYAGWQNGYGKTIVISHGNGLKTKYAHLNSISVSAGQSVEQGETIGKSGNTGRSTGPHLHFEVLLHGEPVNPMNYL